MATTNMTTPEETIALFSSFTEIHATKINGGFRYEGITESGEKVVIRKKATRIYEKAFAYLDAPGSAGYDRHALMNHFTFGKNPNAYGKLAKTWCIKEV